MVAFRFPLLLATVVLAALPARAEEVPLSAEAFDRLTQGTTFDTYSFGSVYGIEQFLPGRRTVWKDAVGCMKGTWEQVGEMICFTYEDDPKNPDCWTYFETAEGIAGYFEGDREQEPILLRPSVSRMDCGEFLGV